MTAPMRIALCGAIDHGGNYQRIPDETNDATVNSLQRCRMVDYDDRITPHGREKLADAMRQWREQ